jgi:hypothetical protein
MHMRSGHSCPLPLTFVRRHHEREGHDSQSCQATHSKPRLQPLRLSWKSGASAPRKLPIKSIWASAPDDLLGAPSLRFLQEPALSGVEGVAAMLPTEKVCRSRKHSENSSLVIPNRAESAVRNLLFHAADPTHAHPRGSHASQAREERASTTSSLPPKPKSGRPARPVGRVLSPGVLVSSICPAR